MASTFLTLFSFLWTLGDCLLKQSFWKAEYKVFLLYSSTCFLFHRNMVPIKYSFMSYRWREEERCCFWRPCMRFFSQKRNPGDQGIKLFDNISVPVEDHLHLVPEYSSLPTNFCETKYISWALDWSSYRDISLMSCVELISLLLVLFLLLPPLPPPPLPPSHFKINLHNFRKNVEFAMIQCFFNLLRSCSWELSNHNYNSELT